MKVSSNKKIQCLSCGYGINSNEFKRIPPSTMDSLVIFDELKIYTCPKCHFSFADKKISDDDLEYYYSESYSGIAKKTSKEKIRININDNWVNKRYLAQFELLRKFYHLRSKSKVLEIGSGIGDFFKTLKYFGIKSNNYALEPGVDAHPLLENLGVEIIKKSLNQLTISELPKKTFDLILMSHSLEHFNSHDIESILNGINNSLKSNGIFLCEVPNADLIKYPNADDLVNPHLTFFSTESIKNFIKKTGFEILFLSTCGNNQLDKIPLTNENFENLKKQNFFNYKLSDDGRVKINIGYHEWLNKRKVYSLGQRLKKTMSQFLKKTNLINIAYKYNRPNIYDIIEDSNFSYSNDREFIRLVAKKNN